VNIEDYPEEYKELQVKCEDVKKKLTNLSSTTVTVQCEGYSGRYDISREFFDDQTANLLNETIILVNKCFEEIGGGFGWHSLDEVVLVGGSTRMPQVKEMIIREYGKPPITKNIDVDTIVAAGAAMQAQLCTENMLVLGGTSAPRPGSTGGGSGGLVIRGSDIQDITAHSLGMLALSKNEKDYVNSIIIQKNSKMNETFGRQYQLNGDKLDVYVLQGESQSPYDCTLLYKYVISGMPKGKKNAFTVNFLYNSNGIVEVNAQLDDGTSLAAKQCEITETISEVIARLEQEREEAKKAARDIEVMFMLDTSYSMEGNPMRQAKNAMHDFVSSLDLGHTKVAILDFADSSRWACEFTNNASTLSRTINSLDVDGPCGIANDETPLTSHGDEFKNREAAKIIVVLTDGIWKHPETEVRTATRLKSSGITIYAVGFGGAREDFLAQIASEKGARKIDLSKLSSTFKEIASSIATEMS
ncbi:MAG: Hsp70 family protein, partial [Clostridia bacterium]|nr:Hsp70 family protein [Clostridia bacterium]